MDCSHGNRDSKTKGIQANNTALWEDMIVIKKILHFFGITVCRRQRSLRKLHTHSQSFGSLTRVVYSCYTLACDELGLLWCFILTSSVHHVCYLKSSFTVPELYSVRCVLLSKAPLPFPFQSTNWHTAPMTLIDVNILCFSAPRWQWKVWIWEIYLLDWKVDIPNCC